MLQAIATKYFGPGNVRGSRVKATCEAGSITLHWDHKLNVDGNHIAAARALASKMGWEGAWMGGALPGSGYAFVIVDLWSGRIDPDFTIERSDG